MPFTFSHPAIVLPLTYLPRKWYSLTGLVIGSLTPDFEYFLRMKVQSNYSHTLTGIFWFDLPLGILLAFIFHDIVRNKLFDNLPKILKSRFFAFKDFDWNKYFQKNWLVVIVSILIGALSHIFWDSFLCIRIKQTKTFPTILTGIKKGMSAYNEEIFGPVASIITANNVAEAIHIANDTNFGLGAAIFTKDIALGEKIAREDLQAGACFVNGFVKSDPRLPFGGIKGSGYGRELGMYGIHEFVNIKTVYIK